MRAAIIGTGYIGRVHARLIRELGGEVVAACGRTLPSAQAFGAGTAYDDVDAMLRAEKPDVVHVCSPNHFHKEHAIKAFRAGAQVFINEALGRQRVFNSHVRDSYEQLSAEVLQLRAEVERLRTASTQPVRAESAKAQPEKTEAGVETAKIRRAETPAHSRKTTPPKCRAARTASKRPTTK